ncbi:MAG: zf-HC2 domain-containing protein [Actinomycetota bacterium]
MTGSDEVDCREVLENLDLLLDPEVSAERRALLEEHLERCKSCLGRYRVEVHFISMVRRGCAVSDAPNHLIVRIRSALWAHLHEEERGSGGSRA